MFGQLDYYFENFTLEDFKEAAFHTVNEMLICLSYKDKNENDVARAREGDPMVMRMTSFIDENIERELNASVLASHLNFSQSYVQNRFLKVMGIGLKRYINQKKIYAARADIIGGMSPNSAAQKYCFSDYSSFFRHYKKIIGISPKDDKREER